VYKGPIWPLGYIPETLPLNHQQSFFTNNPVVVDHQPHDVHTAIVGLIGNVFNERKPDVSVRLSFVGVYATNSISPG